MLAGMGFTWSYIAYFKFWAREANVAANWWLGISPEGIGFIGMILNFAMALTVMHFTAPTPPSVTALVDSIRLPVGGVK